jgi:hypothetical protein
MLVLGLFALLIALAVAFGDWFDLISPEDFYAGDRRKRRKNETSG